MKIEHLLLFQAPWLAVLLVIALMGFPTPLRHVEAGRRAGRAWALVHTLVLVAGVALWARWLLAFGLAERDDALFAILLIVGGSIVALRLPWRGGSLALRIAKGVVRAHLRRHPRASGLLDLARAMAGRPPAKRAVTRQPAEPGRKAPAWALVALREIGLLQAKLRAIPAPRGMLLAHVLPDTLERAAARMDACAATESGLNSDEALEAGRELADLLGAWIEVRFLIYQVALAEHRMRHASPGQHVASTAEQDLGEIRHASVESLRAWAEGTLATVVELLAILEKVDDQREGSCLASAVRSEVRAALMDALGREGVGGASAGEARRPGGASPPPARSAEGWRGCEPTDASLDWLASVLAFADGMGSPRPLELLRRQAQRDSLRITDEIASAEQLARWVVADALLGGASHAGSPVSRARPRRSYPVLALQVASEAYAPRGDAGHEGAPSRRDSAGRDRVMRPNALMDLLRCRILQELAPEADDRVVESTLGTGPARSIPGLQHERRYLGGVQILHRLRAGDPLPRALWTGREDPQ